MPLTERRAKSALALLATALVTGAAAGLVTSCFLWAYTETTHLLWDTLPRRVGVDPYGSWWLFAVPVVGGVLVGLCQRFIGNYPEPLDEAIATWRSGGHLEPAVAPKTGVNSLVALSFGGPVGFEAALTGIIGGMGTWIVQRTRSAGSYVRQAWGAERIEALPPTARRLPYWLAAGAGLFTYHWLPFGGIDLGFRFTKSTNLVDAATGLAAFGFAAFVVVPAAWMVAAVSRAERATLFKRSPVLVAVAGAVVFALLAVPDQLVLFSGQQGMQLLPQTDNGTLAYVTVAKWAALIVALVAGWRGGPIFPTYTSIAAFAVLAAHLFGADPQLLMIAGLAGVSVVFTKGSVVLAFVLTLYPVPLGFAALILIAALGAALAFTIAGSIGVLPRPAGAPEMPPDTAPPSGVGPKIEPAP